MEDDVNITTNKTGIGGGSILGCVGLASLAAVAVAYILGGQPVTQPVPQQPAQQEVQFTIEHFDQHGKPIYVPPADKEP